MDELIQLLSISKKTEECGEMIYDLMSRSSLFDNLFDKIGITAEKDKIMVGMS